MAIAFRSYTKGGHTYGGIVENYRDPETGKSRTKSLRRFGNLDKLRERNPNFMEEVEAELQRLRAEAAPRIAAAREAAIRAKAQSKFSAQLSPVPDTNFTFFSSPVKFGEVILRRQWEELELNQLFAGIGSEFSYDLDAAAYCVTVARLIDPYTRQLPFEELKPSLFDYSQLTRDNLYAALAEVDQRKEQVIAWLNQHAKHDFSSGIIVLLSDVNFWALERVLGSEAGVVAANNSKNGLKSTFCPQDTPVEREALPQTLSRTNFWEPGYNLELLFTADGLPFDFELETCDDTEAMVQRWRERYGLGALTVAELYDRVLPHELFDHAFAFRQYEVTSRDSFRFLSGYTGV